MGPAPGLLNQKLPVTLPLLELESCWTKGAYICSKVTPSPFWVTAVLLAWWAPWKQLKRSPTEDAWPPDPARPGIDAPRPSIFPRPPARSPPPGSSGDPLSAQVAGTRVRSAPGPLSSSVTTYGILLAVAFLPDHGGHPGPRVSTGDRFSDRFISSHF